MEKIYDVIVIGAGPAGCSAALYASSAGYDTLVIEKMSAGGQMALTGDIDNYPGFEQGVDGFTLGMKMQQGAERFGSRFAYSEILSVDFSKEVKRLETTDGVFLARSVIIASGASARSLGLPAESELIGRGVHYCAHCDGRFYKDKTVVVVGGGNSAVSDALYLSRLAKKVYLVHRRDTLKAQKVLRDRLEKAQNVELITDTVLTQILVGDDGRACGTKCESTKDGTETELYCDGIFICIGRKPATDFLGGALVLDKDGYIVADESTRTNVSGVYAAGDVRTKLLRQVVTAVADGASAVHSASIDILS